MDSAIGLFSMFIILLVFLAMGMPVAFSIAISASIILVLVVGIPLSQVVFASVGMVSQWIWVALPLFIILGDLLCETGLIDRLINFSQSLIGHVPGSLSHVVILAHIMMAGMSGSISADAAAIGAAMAPSMKRAGYSPGYIAAIVGVGAIIGPTIPPSSPLIIFGVIGEVSILRLWLGGIVPGFLIGIVLLVIGYFRCKRKNYATLKSTTWSQKGRVGLEALPALALPIFILGGMRLGMFTAVEGAAIAVLYTLIIAFTFYHFRKVNAIIPVFIKSAKVSAAIMLLIAMAGIFTFTLTTLGAGPIVSNFMTSITTNPVLFLLIVIVVFLFLGCFIESIPLQMIFVGLLMPTVNAYGIDPVQFGVIFTLVIMIGMVTPPVGACMYLVCRLTNADILEYTKEALPFLLGVLGVVFLMALCPPIVTFLPNLIMGTPIL